MMWCVFSPRTSVTCSVMRGRGDERRARTPRPAAGRTAGRRGSSRRRARPVAEERPAGQVERDVDERLVERERRLGEAAHAGLVAERLARTPRPSTMPTSSTVWWPSISRSPWRATTRSNPPCRPSWSACGRRTGSPVSTRRRARAVERRASTIDRSPSSTRSVAAVGDVLVVAGSPAKRVEEGIVFGRGADRDPQAPLEARPRRAVAHEHRAIEQRLPHFVARRCRAGGTSTKFAPDGHTSTRQVGQRGDQPAPLLDQVRRPAPPSRRRSRARARPRSA